MANRIRNERLEIKLTEEEKALFEEKRKLARCRNMSHFIRKCVLEKEIYQVDLEPFRDLQGLLSNATNNINQIAKRVNSTGVIYKDDINDIKMRLNISQKSYGKFIPCSLTELPEVIKSYGYYKIHPIKSTLNLAISYIVNGEKTDEQILVSTHKCHQETAHTQFLRTRNDVGTNGTVLARHLIQSFLPGEASPEMAHQIGMELCKRY